MTLVFRFHLNTGSLTKNVKTHKKQLNIIIIIIIIIIMETICVFECTILNLAAYRQFTNAA